MAEASEDSGDTIWGWCPNCRGRRKALLLFEHDGSQRNSYGVLAADIRHRVIECAGCERAYFQTVGRIRDLDIHAQGEDEAPEFGPMQEACFPRIQIREIPAWIAKLHATDATMGRWSSDVYFSLDNDRNGLAAIAARTVVDRILLLIGCDPNLTFAQKVEWAIERGHIYPNERDYLESLFEAGSAAAHRAWEPRYDEIIAVIVLLEHLIYRIMIARDDAATLKSLIPARKQEVAKNKMDS
jgi:hypothetical protein